MPTYSDRDRALIDDAGTANCAQHGTDTCMGIGVIGKSCGNATLYWKVTMGDSISVRAGSTFTACGW